MVSLPESKKVGKKIITNIITYIIIMIGEEVIIFYEIVQTDDDCQIISASKTGVDYHKNPRLI